MELNEPFGIFPNSSLSMAYVDGISELPESILHHILSFLCQKRAIRTSALSKSWRHLGPTRPKIELRESYFEKSGGKPTFLSVLSNTLERYNHRNLSVHEFILEMSSMSDDDRQLLDSESTSVIDKVIQLLLTNMGVRKLDFAVPHYFLAPSVVFRAQFLTELCLSECKFMNIDQQLLDEPLFKGLKRFSLNNVRIEKEMLEKITRSCPLIEYLCLNKPKNIPVALNLSTFQTESLTELRLCVCKVMITELLLIKRLKTLSIDNVYIQDETLEKIMCSSCPLIERVFLCKCVGLTGIRFNMFFPRLKSLYLHRVRLFVELFESFSSNFPSLEDLELQNCYGFHNIQLTICSIKRLVISFDSSVCISITVYAPKIHYFEFSGYHPPLLKIYTETAREWKSHIIILFGEWPEEKVLPHLLQLSKLLNSLSASQMSLDVQSYPFKNLKVEDTNDAGFYKPVPLEHIRVNGNNRFPSFPHFFNCLFLICRPRYIGMNGYIAISENGRKKEKNKLAEFIILNIIRNQGDMSTRFPLWEQDLVEISMEAWDEKSQGWHTVCLERTSFPGFISYDTKIRFPLRWRD